MTNLDRQLQAILADPDDDSARLAYADLLEEHRGDAERAEFVRAQCLKGDLSYRLQYAVDKHNWQRVFGCGRVLQDVVWAHKERTGSFPGYSWGSSPSPTGPGLYKSGAAEVWVKYTNVLKAVARRGFIEHLTIAAEAFLQVADTLFACQPVTEVTLTTELDWYSPSLSGVLALEAGGVELRCRRAEYGCWWGASSPGVVLDHVLRKEWPGVVFHLVEDVRS